MSEGEAIQIEDVHMDERQNLETILDESFEGIYLRHARRTLKEIETVRAAYLGKIPVGVAMLKLIRKDVGYVYYIAVGEAYRGRKIGSKLLDDAIGHFASLKVREVYASVGTDNVESNALFRAKGFRKTDYGEVSKKYGRFHSVMLYRAMLVVPGEIVLVLDKEIANRSDSLDG